MWRDKSGLGRNYIQTTSGSRPSFANNTVTCTTSSQLLTSTLPLGITGIDIFVVVKPLPAAGNSWRTLFRGDATDHPILVESGTTRLGYYANAANGFNPFGSLTLDGTTRALIYVNIPANRIASASLNGTFALSSGSAAMSASANFQTLGNNTGAGQPWGDINEVILVSNTTTTDRQSIEGYLAWKWGLKSSLPTTHPFALIKPHARTFQPIDIPGCKMWLDGADQTTMTPANAGAGTSITAWKDKSSNAITLASGVVATRPTLTLASPTFVAGGGLFFNNATNGLWVNGVTQGFSAGPTYTGNFANFTMFVVAAQPSGLPNGYNSFIFVESTGAYPNLSFVDFNAMGPGGYGGLFISNIVNIGFNNSRFPAPARTLATLDVKPTGASIFYNGVLNTTTAFTYTQTTFSTVGIVHIGNQAPGNRSFPGTIYEIIWYEGISMTLSQRQQVEGYLRWKWQSTALSTTHPFFRFPSSSALPFNPSGIPGCQLWLDAADPAGTGVLPSAGTLATWVDKSGNGRNGTGAGTVPSFALSPSRVTFGGSGYYNTTLTAMPTVETVFIVSSTTITITLFLIGGTVIGSRTIYQVSGSMTTNSDNVATYATQTGALTNGNMFVTGLTLSGGNSQMFVNGTGGTVVGGSTYSGSGTTQIGAIRSGAAATFNGAMNEILIYNTNLTTSQRQGVEGYLAWKWGLQNSLPNNHPYYRFSPKVLSTPSIVSTGLILNLNANTYVSGTTWIPSIGNIWNLVSGPTVSPGLTTDGTTVLTTNGSSSYMNDPTGVNFQGAFSIDIWVFVPTPSTNGNILTESQGGYQWTPMYVSNSTFFGAPYRIGDGSGAAAQSLGTCTANRWTNLCFTNSASGTSTYVGYSNGIQQSTTSYTRIAPGGNSFFGLAQGGLGNPNFGYKALSVGAIKFYNVALTATQVKQNYDSLSSRFILNP
jgi:hypothetical protein